MRKVIQMSDQVYNKNIIDPDSNVEINKKEIRKFKEKKRKKEKGD